MTQATVCGQHLSDYTGCDTILTGTTTQAFFVQQQKQKIDYDNNAEAFLCFNLCNFGLGRRRGHHNNFKIEKCNNQRGGDSNALVRNGYTVSLTLAAATFFYKRQPRQPSDIEWQFKQRFCPRL